MSVQVVVQSLDAGTLEEVKLDLQTSTLQLHFGTELTFCYYWEINQDTVLAGMWPAWNPTFRVFVLLVNDEPVSMSAGELGSYLEQHPEFIPDQV